MRRIDRERTLKEGRIVIIINTTQHNTTQHNATQRNATQRNTTQRNATQDYTRL